MSPALRYFGIFILTGLMACGIPGPPQPPSLNLPRVVDDLEAHRVGDSVVLGWTAPVLNTDKTAVRAGGVVHICRAQQESTCTPVGQVTLAAGQQMKFVDSLPAALLAGDPQPVSYAVAVSNAQGRDAGWSAGAVALAGRSVAATSGLAAENTAAGIQLRWSDHAGSVAPGTVFRVERTDVSSSATAKKSPPVQVLEVACQPGQPTPAGAVDRTREWGHTYHYVVQAEVRVREPGGSAMLIAAGVPSKAVEVTAKNVFPPAAPTGLAVVPVWGSDGAPGMDLNWRPNSEATVAGYRVVRIMRPANGSKRAERIVFGNDKLLTTPAFADRGLDPRASYEYSIVAVDTAGNVSDESVAVRATALAGPD